MHDLLGEQRSVVEGALDLDLVLELLLERLEVSGPRTFLDGLHRDGQLLEGELRIADDCDVRGHRPFDLERVDVDLDDARVAGEVAAEAGLELLEPAAHDQHRVRLVHRPGT